MPDLRPTCDGVVTIRPPERGDASVLIAGRDETFHRFLGAGSDDPQPTGCIVVDGEIVGWVDYDVARPWLERGEVNVGYNVFAPHRGNGYATRAVQLLMHHLTVDTDFQVATLLIDRHNERSLALAGRARFKADGDLDANRYFKRSVPPLTYTDGTVTIRCPTAEDLDADLAAKDDQQIDWLWLPGQRQRWEAMTSEERRVQARHHLQGCQRAFASGPKWSFAVDTADVEYVAYVDCDLRNQHVPPGDANVSYASHPAHRRQGHVIRAVRLLLLFLADHTGARSAHLIVDEANAASRRVAAGVGVPPTQRWSTDDGKVMLRHVVSV